MAAIFPPQGRGGVAPGPNVVNGFTPTHDVIGEGPLYISPECSTVLTDGQMNAIVSEILAAVDELGFAYNSTRIDNLGQALNAILSNVVNEINSRVLRSGDTMAGPLALAGPPANDNEAADKGYVDGVTDALRTYVDQQDAAIMLANQQAIGALDAAKVDRIGDTMAGPLMLAGNPSEPFEAATKQYVDTSIAAGGHFVDAPLDGRTFGRNIGSWVEVPGFADVIRYDYPQALTEAQTAQARQNVYAAPLDAAASNGVQVDGGMEIAQAGAGIVYNIQPNSTVYVTDLWAVASSSGGAAGTAQQVDDAPPGYRKSLKITVAIPQPSLAPNNFMLIYHHIEGTRIARMALGTAQGMPISIALWVKAHRPGLYSGDFRNGLHDWGCPFPIQINQPDTWEYKTATLPPPPVGAVFANDGTLGAQLFINMAASTDRQAEPLQWAQGITSGAAVLGQINGVAEMKDSLQITGVVILPGIDLPPASHAPLIMRPYADELWSSQRYYNRLSVSIRFNAPAAFSLQDVPLFFVPMRVAPTPTEIAGNRNNIALINPQIFSSSGARLEAESQTAGDTYALGETLVLDARV